MTRIGSWMARRSWLSLWLALGLSLAVNGGFLMLAAYRLSIIPFQPICWDEHRSFPIGVSGGLYGRMKPEFRNTAERNLNGSSMRYDKIFGDVIVITFADWWEDFHTFKLSYISIDHIVQRQTGMPVDVAMKWLFPSETYHLHRYSASECVIMRPIAMMPDGEEFFRPEDDPVWEERLSRKPPKGYEDWKVRLEQRSK